MKYQNNCSFGSWRRVSISGDTLYYQIRTDHILVVDFYINFHKFQLFFYYEASFIAFGFLCYIFYVRNYNMHVQEFEVKSYFVSKQMQCLQNISVLLRPFFPGANF